MNCASIPVDVFNPGQVFACLGFMELSEVLLGEVRAGFDWSDSSRTRFVLRASVDTDPFSAALKFLSNATLCARLPYRSELDTTKWKVTTQDTPRGEPFPIPPPSGPDTLPAVLEVDDRSVMISSWGETRARDVVGTRRDNVKFWAGAGGYPGVALMRDALEAVRDDIVDARMEPFSLAARQSSSFRFDWRRDYIPIDIGFSLNEHARMQPVGYPLVEILAAVGLTHARPRREEKLKYSYSIAGRRDAAAPESAALLPPPIVRAALGSKELPFASRSFAISLDWPGQTGQARCITTVHEETNQ